MIQENSGHLSWNGLECRQEAILSTNAAVVPMIDGVVCKYVVERCQGHCQNSSHCTCKYGRVIYFYP